MWCLVSQPNAVLLEVEVDAKAKGQECLAKVCQCLGISHESDYFGLKYTNHKGEDLWLNLRNPIEHQMNGIPPFRLALRVKFWVPPHMLLQETTRHQFHLNAILDLKDGRMQVRDWTLASRLVALIAQAENGDVASEAFQGTCLKNYTNFLNFFCTHSLPQQPSDILQRIMIQHKNLTGMKSSTADYWVLKEVSSLPGYGEELFQTQLLCGSPGPALGVGPHGITIYSTKKQVKDSVPYSAVISIASNKRQLVLRYLTLNSKEHIIAVKLESTQSASGLYRAITEKHAFYSCETVKDAVITQFIRDLKGTIASIFKEDSTLGLKYVFDIQRTCREVYDNARRALYQSESQEISTSLHTTSVSSKPEEHISLQLDSMDIKNIASLLEGGCKACQDKESYLHEAMLCRICMDCSIDAVIFPCAHVMSCVKCAEKCESCPICRASISEVRRVFLPIDIFPHSSSESSQTLCVR